MRKRSSLGLFLAGIVLSAGGCGGDMPREELPPLVFDLSRPDLVAPPASDLSSGDAAAADLAGPATDAATSGDIARAPDLSMAPQEDLAGVQQDLSSPGDAAPADGPSPDLVKAEDLAGPCVEGAACTPLAACHVGKVTCKNGTAVCMDTGAKKTNGSTCGVDRFCFNGVCNTCVVGKACTPLMGCHVGTTSCMTGTAVCVDTMKDAPDGTPCGTDLVCSQGKCAFCAANKTCLPNNNPCRVGKTECSTGKSLCQDTGMVPNGSTCGKDMVCSNSMCVACVAGASCMHANPCAVATIQCATGQPVCTVGSFLADGASCGNGMVCLAGKCVACNKGAACAPKDPCHLGAIDCGMGNPVCVDTGKPGNDGTMCGNKMYCFAGTCRACDPTQKCTTNMGCSTGTISCDTGQAMCVATGRANDGISCVDGNGMALKDKVCFFGLCVDCKKDAPCEPENVCHVGKTDCSKGPVCVDTGANVQDGLDCGFGKKCQGGVCK